MEEHKSCVLCQWKRDKGQAAIMLVGFVQLSAVLHVNRDVLILNVQRPSEASSSLTMSTKHAAHAELNINYATVQDGKTNDVYQVSTG